MYIDGLTIRYGKDQASKGITLFKGTYKNQYYGFDSTYVPQNITINNFHVQEYTATVTNGVRSDEIDGAKNAITVYLYYALRDLKAEDVPATSEAGANKPTDTTSKDYGTNHLECTKTLVITDSVTFTLPTGTFWQNMKVMIDGVKYVYTPSANTKWAPGEWKNDEE